MTKISVMKKAQKNTNDSKFMYTKELCEALYFGHTSIARLYAFAGGIKEPKKKTAKNYRSLEDDRRLLWSAQILKNQMIESEKKLNALITSSLAKRRLHNVCE